MRRTTVLVASILMVSACGDTGDGVGFAALDSAGFTELPSAGTQLRATTATLDPLGPVDVRPVGDAAPVTVTPLNTLGGGGFQAEFNALDPTLPLSRTFAFDGDVIDRPPLAADFVRLASLDGDDRLVTSDPELLPLAFTRFGIWEQPFVPGTPVGPATTLAFGFETPVGVVPAGESAVFIGRTIGRLDQAGLPTGPLSLDLVGDARLAVDFAAATVVGEFTNLRALEVGATEALNFIEPVLGFSATATITGGGFAGTTQATGLTALAPEPMQGEIAGTFMGPSAEEVAGAWSLRGDTAVAVGSFGALR